MTNERMDNKYKNSNVKMHIEKKLMSFVNILCCVYDAVLKSKRGSSSNADHYKDDQK